MTRVAARLQDSRAAPTRPPPRGFGTTAPPPPGPARRGAVGSRHLDTRAVPAGAGAAFLGSDALGIARPVQSATVPHPDPSAQPRWPGRLPLIDGLAALLAGGVVLALTTWLSDLYSLSPQLVRTLGAINVGDSVLGLTLTALPRHAVGSRRRLLLLLIFANVAWVVVCAGLAVRLAADASLFGLLHLVGEGCFVGALAGLEWKYRRQIVG